MSMIWRDPFEAPISLREAMSRLFEGGNWPERFEAVAGRTFPVDVYESKDQQEYIVEAPLPGAKPEDIVITAMGNTLTIRYATKSEEKVEKPNYVRHERYEGEMSRVITLPGPINPDKIQAKYERGVLTLRVSNAEGAKPKQIPVQPS
ncbi:MAG TPA: Hsp20/alpha crystallin family protein [Ktedonobacteraceae bacterium]|nr:Hsp20/alpha crystallin family protein [Ktedonobacteraceae bacterium]